MIHQWETSTSKPVKTFETGNTAESIAAKDNRLYIPNVVGRIEEYDIDAGEPLRTFTPGLKHIFPCASTIKDLIISERMLVGICKCGVEVWDLETDKNTCSFHLESFNYVDKPSVIHNKKLFYIVRDKIQVWDLVTKKIIQTIQYDEDITAIEIYKNQLFTGHYNGVIMMKHLSVDDHGVILSKNGLAISTITVQDDQLFCGNILGAIKKWSLKGDHLLTFAAQGILHVRVNGIIVSNGILYSASSIYGVKARDVITGKDIQEFDSYTKDLVRIVMN